MTKESIAAIAKNAIALAGKGISPDTLSMSALTMAKHSIHATHVMVRAGDEAVTTEEQMEAREKAGELYHLEIRVNDAIAEGRFLVSGTQVISTEHAEG
jgi:hypothetical protein